MNFNTLFFGGKLIHCKYGGTLFLLFWDAAPDFVTCCRSFQFGAIGTIIGHELTHAFDNNGRQYDKNGNKLQWWTDNSIKAFENKTQCLVDQYSSYYWDTADDYVSYWFNSSKLRAVIFIASE